MNYYQRMLVVAFFVGNGLSLPLTLVLLIRLSKYPFDITKIIALHRWFSDLNNRGRNMYYYFDIILGKSFYFNGVERKSTRFRGDTGPIAYFTQNGRHQLRISKFE